MFVYVRLKQSVVRHAHCRLVHVHSLLCQTGVNSTCYLNSGTMACAWCVLCLRAKSSNQSHLAPHPKTVNRNEDWVYSMICLRVYIQMHSLLCPAGGEKAWARQHSHHERNGPDIQRALHRGLHP